MTIHPQPNAIGDDDGSGGVFYGQATDIYRPKKVGAVFVMEGRVSRTSSRAGRPALHLLEPR